MNPKTPDFSAHLEFLVATGCGDGVKASQWLSRGYVCAMVVRATACPLAPFEYPPVQLSAAGSAA